MAVVIDASALLAWLHSEAGGAAIAPTLHDAAMSAVNWSEAVQKSLFEHLSGYPFDPMNAYFAATFYCCEYGTQSVPKCIPTLSVGMIYPMKPIKGNLC